MYPNAFQLRVILIICLMMLLAVLTACGGSDDPIEPSIDGPSDDTVQPTDEKKTIPSPMHTPQCQASGVCS